MFHQLVDTRVSLLCAEFQRLLESKLAVAGRSSDREKLISATLNIIMVSILDAFVVFQCTCQFRCFSMCLSFYLFLSRSINSSF